MKRITITDYPSLVKNFRDNSINARNVFPGGPLAPMEILIITKWGSHGGGERGNGEIYHFPVYSPLYLTFFNRVFYWSSQFLGQTDEETKKLVDIMLDGISLSGVFKSSFSFQLFPADIKFFISPIDTPPLPPPELTAGELWEGLGWRVEDCHDIMDEVEEKLKERKPFIGKNVTPGIAKPKGKIHFFDYPYSPIFVSPLSP